MPPRRNDAPRANANRNDQMAEAMNNMAASVAAQTAAKTQRDLEKRGREIRAAESRGLKTSVVTILLSSRGMRVQRRRVNGSKKWRKSLI